MAALIAVGIIVALTAVSGSIQGNFYEHIQAAIIGG